MKKLIALVSTKGKTREEIKNEVMNLYNSKTALENERMAKAVYQYKLSYMEYNVDTKKFPRIKSLSPKKAVELTDQISKDHPKMKINKILEILEKNLNNQ